MEERPYLIFRLYLCFTRKFQLLSPLYDILAKEEQKDHTIFIFFRNNLSFSSRVSKQLTCHFISAGAANNRY